MFILQLKVNFSICLLLRDLFVKLRIFGFGFNNIQLNKQEQGVTCYPYIFFSILVGRTEAAVKKSSYMYWKCRERKGGSK